MGDEAEIRYALSLSEDDLLAELGAALVGTSTGNVRDGESENLRNRARNWLQRNRGALREELCREESLAAANSNSLVDAAAVADLISQSLLNKPAAYTVAAILLKRGLDRLCAEYDSASPS